MLPGEACNVTRMRGAGQVGREAVTSKRLAEQVPPPPAVDEALLAIWRVSADGDGLLPSEKELSAQLGIGRNTVREALIRLEADGLVARRHGAGTFTNPAALEVQIRVDRTAEYSQLLTDAGFEAQVEVFSSGWVQLDQVAAEKLSVEPGSLAFRTEKRWLADGSPVMYAVDLVPSRQRADVDPSKSVLALSFALSGRVTEWVCSWVEAVQAGELGRRLDCPPSQPVLALEQVGVARNGQRCWLADERHNPGRHSRGIRYGLVRTVSWSGARPD